MISDWMTMITVWFSSRPMISAARVDGETRNRSRMPLSMSSITAIPLQPAEKNAVIRFGQVEVDLDRQIVAREGTPLDVSPQEFKVLRLFLTSNGRALSRDDILARCWGAEYEGTPRTVDNFVRSLRVKLEVNAEEPRHFLTVRGHGYRFER